MIEPFSLWMSQVRAENGQKPASPQNSPLGGSVTPFIPLILMFAIFYFLVIRPQQKKTKNQQKFLTELKRGDRVVTNGGLIGVVKNLSDKLVTLEVDDNVCIKILRSQLLESAESLREEKKTS